MSIDPHRHLVEIWQVYGVTGAECVGSGLVHERVSRLFGTKRIGFLRMPRYSASFMRDVSPFGLLFDRSQSLLSLTHNKRFLYCNENITLIFSLLTRN